MLSLCGLGGQSRFVRDSKFCDVVAREEGRTVRALVSLAIVGVVLCLPGAPGPQMPASEKQLSAPV